MTAPTVTERLIAGDERDVYVPDTPASRALGVARTDRRVRITDTAAGPAAQLVNATGTPLGAPVAMALAGS